MPNKPKHAHNKNDRIMTPEDLVVELIKKIPALPDDSWCDPCYGQGVFFRNFPTKHKRFYEIDMDRDFLSVQDRQWDWCVTNIPFSQPKEFIFKMAECSKKGFGILCLANSMTATRLEKLKSINFYLHSVTVVYVRAWGFGYRTDFYVFTREPTKNLTIKLL